MDVPHMRNTREPRSQSALEYNCCVGNNQIKLPLVNQSDKAMNSVLQGGCVFQKSFWLALCRLHKPLHSNRFSHHSTVAKLLLHHTGLWKHNHRFDTTFSQPFYEI